MTTSCKTTEQQMSDAYSSCESDAEVIDNLMFLLDAESSEKDFSKVSERENITELAELINFSLNENGQVNYRDQTVLGKHTKIKIPMSMLSGTERLRLSVHLDYDVPASAASMVSRPYFEAKELRTRDRDFRENFPIGDNECWMDPKDLVGRSKEEDGVFTLKKRRWQLSRGFRKVVNSSLPPNSPCVKYPKFVVVISAYRSEEGVPKMSESVKTASFEVRSKEQSKQTRAARGLAEPIRRRRTPETEARAATLRAIQSEIIAMRSEIEREKAKFTEFQTCHNFIRSVTSNCEAAADISSLF